VRNLKGEYHGGMGVDTSLRWDVTFSIANESHAFTLWNFTYGGLWRKPEGRTIPEPAVKLGCLFESLNDQIRNADRHSPLCTPQNEGTH
jgi:hypothetical protein